jgi:hypothetical protein
MWLVLLVLWIIGDIIYFAYLRANPALSRDMVDFGKSQLAALAQFLKVVAIGTASTAFFVAAAFLSASRWRRPRVFISYHLAGAPEAEELARRLQRQHCHVILIKQATPTHDSLLEEIQSAIRHCDAVVALPGTRQSFVDAELLTASTLKRSIIIVANELDTLPNTVYTGYPVLDRDAVVARHYAPVAQLVLIDFQHWSIAIRWLRQAATKSFLSSLGMCILTIIAGYLIDLVDLNFKITAISSGVVALGMFELSLIGCAGLFAVSLAIAIFRRLSASRIIKQKVVTSRVTKDELLRLAPELKEFLLKTELALRH